MSLTITTENATINSRGIVICDEDGREYEDIVDLDKEEFIQVMLCLHQPIRAENGDLCKMIK